jgi:hypothetical protein
MVRAQSGNEKLAGKLMLDKYKNRFMVLIPGNAVTPLSFTSTGGIFLLLLNTSAFYAEASITIVKCLIVKAPGTNVTKICP